MMKMTINYKTLNTEVCFTDSFIDMNSFLRSFNLPVLERICLQKFEDLGYLIVDHIIYNSLVSL